MRSDPSSACGRMFHVTCYRDRDALILGVAARLKTEFIRQSEHPFSVLLSGGSTPFPAYNQVAENPVRPSPNLYVAFTDERHVPPNSDAGNVANTHPLIDALGLAWSHVIYPRTELELEPCTQDYEQQCKAFLEKGGSIPLALLGLGSDGHTCSLFDDHDLERGKNRLAVSVKRPDGLDGISVTPTLLRMVDEILFLVAGPDKREALHHLIRHPESVTAGKVVEGHSRVCVWTEPEAWSTSSAAGRSE